MIKIDKLTDASALRAFATKEGLSEALFELSIKAVAEDMLPHIIQVHCSTDFLQTSEFEIILWGD